MGFFSAFFGKKAAEAAFLSTLSGRARQSVANLSPMAYRAILMEKEGRNVELQGIDRTILDFLRTLSPEELESLECSVKALKKADALSESDQMNEAAAAYKEAFEHNPYNDLALMSYGGALANTGDVHEGIRWVEKALQVNPDNDRARRNLEGMRNLIQDAS